MIEPAKFNNDGSFLWAIADYIKDYVSLSQFAA